MEAVATIVEYYRNGQCMFVPGEKVLSVHISSMMHQSVFQGLCSIRSPPEYSHRLDMSSLPSA
jgi:hypothetical protein